MKVRTEAKRIAIVAAAAELFKAQGYERASMNELARRIGGSKATLYGYFPSKEALFGAVVRQVATHHLTAATQQLQTGLTTRAALEANLLAFAREMLRILSDDSGALAVYRMVMAEAGRSDAGELFHAAGPKECAIALSAHLQEAVDRGLIRAGEPSLFAAQLLSLVTAEVNQRAYQRHPAPMTEADIARYARRAVEMFLLGAAPR